MEFLSKEEKSVRYVLVKTSYLLFIVACQSILFISYELKLARELKCKGCV